MPVSRDWLPGRKKIYFYLFLFWIFSIILISVGCTEKPSEISQYIPVSPGLDSLFNKTSLKSDGDFQIGYQNGYIRSNQVRLDWKRSNEPNFLSYQLFRNRKLIATITERDSTYLIDTGLRQNTYYRYKIVELLQNGMFKFDTLLIKTPRFQPPLILGFEYLTSQQLKIFWKNYSESAREFVVYRKKNQQSNSNFVELGITADTFFVDTSVTPDSEYLYQLRAFNQFETTNTSIPFYVKYDYHLYAPELLSVLQFLGDPAVSLKWMDNSNVEQGFRIYRSSDNQNYQLIDSVGTDSISYYDLNTRGDLQLGNTYYYYITAYRFEEESPPSNSISITLETSDLEFVEIGTDSIEWMIPFLTYFGKGRSQLIYLASEIGSPLLIKKIGLNIASPPPVPVENFQIRMKHTTWDVFSTTEFDNENLTLCLKTDVDITTTGWVEFPLTKEFLYNGNNNLLIDFSFKNPNRTYYNGICYHTDTGENRGIFQYPTFYGNTSFSPYIPNIRLYIK